MVLVNIRIRDPAPYNLICLETYRIINSEGRNWKGEKREAFIEGAWKQNTTEKDASGKTKKGRRQKSYE